MAADFYAVLGLDRSATDVEIRRAYRRLVRELHPDAADGPVDSARLRSVLEAYSVLGHPARRAAYDNALRRAEAVLPLWAGWLPQTPWPERSVFDDPEFFRIMMRWFPFRGG